PRVLNHFEPWMALSFTEGSIGGDIEKAELGPLAAFYGGEGAPRIAMASEPETGGSNGIAIAPALTRDGHALLLINPHTSFFFRSQIAIESGEGLHAYGASTWGQFFLYQGFNERLGWMHTSSGVDAIDEWHETIVKKGDNYSYKHGTAERPMTVKSIKVPYKTANGLAERSFITYRTHH